MNTIDQVKSILKRAIETNDEELISLANNLLAGFSSTKQEIKTVNNNVNPDNNQFIFTRSKQEQDKKRGIPVNEVRNRVNQFYDDGTEAKDIITPDIKPTERKREAYKSIEQICQRCNRTVSTHPKHKREFFVCDRCIGK